MQDLKNCVHARAHVRAMYAKTLERVNFEIPLILKILVRYFTEVFYYYFIETSFVIRH